MCLNNLSYENKFTPSHSNDFETVTMATGCVFSALASLIAISYSKSPQDSKYIATSTPVKLFGSKFIDVSYDDLVLTSIKNDDWHSIGFEYIINPDDTFIIEIESTSIASVYAGLHFALGFATKDVIQSGKDNHVGMYEYGWCYHCSGWIFDFGERKEFVKVLSVKQRLRLRYEKGQFTVFIDDEKVDNKIQVGHIFDNDKDKEYYPAISIARENMKIRIVDFTVISSTKSEL